MVCVPSSFKPFSRIEHYCAALMLAIGRITAFKYEFVGWVRPDAESSNLALCLSLVSIIISSTLCTQALVLIQVQAWLSVKTFISNPIAGTFNWKMHIPDVDSGTAAVGS